MSLNSSQQIGQTIGAKIRAARLAKKNTQSQLAQPDFSVSYISAIERGQIQPSLRALEILAKRLELSTVDLLPSHEQSGARPSLRSGNASSMGEERELQLLEAQISLHQGNPEQAIGILRPLLTQKGERRQDSSVYYALGWAYLEGGHLQESEQALAEAIRQARSATDALYPRILYLQSAIYTAMHNPARAIQLQQESLACLEQQPAAMRDVFFLARVCLSMGQHYTHLGQFDKALEIFGQGLAALQAGTSGQQLQSTYWGLAQSYKEREEPQLATLAGYKWLRVDLQLRLTTLKSEIQHSLGRALLKSKPSEAYAYLLAVSQEAGARQDPLTRASANAHLAAWFVGRGEFSEAEAYTREALALAGPFGETLIRADALLLQGEIAYARQAYLDGDEYFASGLAALEKVGEYAELVERQASYARLLEERGFIQKALLYWKQAYASREKSRAVSL